MKYFFVIIACLLMTSCGCPSKCAHKPLKETDALGFPNISTVPEFPTNYPTQADWTKIRKDLHPESQ